MALALGAALALVLLVLAIRFGTLWLRAFFADADVSFPGLVAMSLRGVDPDTIVTAKIMGRQAGLNIDRNSGMSTARLESHALAGGNVKRVIQAIIAAYQAGMDLDFDRAAAMDLAGRDVLEAVQTSVSPKIIDCPDPSTSERGWLSAIAADGIEMQVHARVTVRTCLDQLIGGATEETIIARVGQGIISTIGSSASYMEVMATPDQISKSVLDRGLDTNTAFEIVSIDIASIAIGQNIGARLQTEQAAADTRTAQAAAEARRANAVAWEQEMVADKTGFQAQLVQAEAEVPLGLAEAIRAGQFGNRKRPPPGKFPRINRPAI